MKRKKGKTEQSDEADVVPFLYVLAASEDGTEVLGGGGAGSYGRHVLDSGGTLGERGFQPLEARIQVFDGAQLALECGRDVVKPVDNALECIAAHPSAAVKVPGARHPQPLAIAEMLRPLLKQLGKATGAEHFSALLHSRLTDIPIPPTLRRIPLRLPPLTTQ